MKQMKPVNFINNKLFIMIAIFIVILLIAVMCYSMNNTELFTSVKNFIIILYLLVLIVLILILFGNNFKRKQKNVINM